MNFLHHKKTTPAKRFLSLLCVLALCLGLLPVTALAEETVPAALYVGNQQLNTSATTFWTTDEQGNLTSSTENDNWNVKYEPSSATLTLKGATIKGGSTDVSFGAGIYAVSSANSDVALTINLEGTSTVSGDYGIYVQANQTSGSDGNSALLTISGDGTLIATGNSSYGIAVFGYKGGAALTIEDASVDAKTTVASSNYAGVIVRSGSIASDSPEISLTVKGGSLTASGGSGSSKGIWFYVGNPNATATTSLTIGGNAIVDAKSGGISATQDMSQFDTTINTTGSNGGIVWNGKDGTVYGDVTLQDELSIESGETLTIPEGAKLDCNNNLTNNGTIVNAGGTLSGTPSGSGTVVNAPTIGTQPASQSVTVGETAEFSVIATGENLSYQWQQKTSSSDWADIQNETSATYAITNTAIDMSGTQYRCVVSNSAGSVTSSAATLTVNAATVPVTGVSLDKTTLYLYTGDSVTLTAAVAPSDATNQNVTWQSDNANVATVEGGVVTAKGAGETTISVTTGDGNYTATCKVTVKSRPSYNPPTVSEKTIDAIQNAKPGETVTVDLSRGSTTLDKDVFETLAGKDVTLVVELGDGVSWTVNGSDIPEDADFVDIDLGVTMNSDGIPVEVVNAITGERDSVQLTLAHDGAFGFTMTLAAPLGEENAGYWANLYYFNESTNKMTFETAAKINSDGTANLSFSHASQYAIVIDDHNHGVIDLPFTDVADSDWFYDPVCFVYSQGLMTGTSATTFEPNTPLSRAMLVAVLHRLEGSPQASGGDFTDVSDGDWYAQAVNWAASVGVVNGFDDGSFQPNAAITREQMAAILRNYAQYKGLEVTASGSLSTFTDAASVSDWAKESVEWAVGSGLIGGYEDSTLRPQGTTTRAEVASVLQRALGNVAGNQ